MPFILQYGSNTDAKRFKERLGDCKIKLVILQTAQAIEALKQDPDETNVVLHVTCLGALVFIRGPE